MWIRNNLFLSSAVFRIRMDPGFSADPDPGLKVRIRPFINLCDLNDGCEKVLEEPDQKRQCFYLPVLDMKCNIFFYFYPSFRTFSSWIRIRIFGRSGAGLRKKV